jgi:hypothetical protein
MVKKHGEKVEYGRKTGRVDSKKKGRRKNGKRKEMKKE